MQLTGLKPLVVTAVVLLIATFTHAQTSQFIFDDNGNLTVQSAATIALPQILGQPQNQIVSAGEPAAFSVIVADPRQLTYQWRFNGVDVGSATNEAFLLQNASTNNEGEYRVMLTNPSGSVTSAPARLWIDNDGDDIPDSWERAHFTNLAQKPNGDFDKDGSSNLQEFLNGTDPTDPNSVRFQLTVVVRDGSGGSVVVTPGQPSYAKGETVTLSAVASSNGAFHAWLGDVLTQDNPLTLVMTDNKMVDARFTPITFFWTNLTSGDWNVATNWTPNLVPGSNDTVIINGTATVTLNTPADCFDLIWGEVGAPTLTGSGTLTVRRDFHWTAGTMSGSGRTILEAGATLTLDNPSAVILSGRTVENGGRFLRTGVGTLVLDSGIVITNRPGALFDVQSAGAFASSSPLTRIDNAGTFRKSKGTGTIILPSSISFNNSGVVEIQPGTMVFLGAFTNTGVVILSAGTTNRLAGGGSATGSFVAPATALVEWSGGTFALNSDAQLNGPGLYKLNRDIVTANANLTVENLDLVSAFSTLSGTGTVTVSGTMNWTGGAMIGGGRTLIQSGATLNINAGVGLNNRTLENAGTVLWTGAGFSINSAVIITNRAGALFEVRNAAPFEASRLNRFDNAGTFRKSVSTGTTWIRSGMSFNNYGTVDIRSGILQADGGYVSSPNAVLNCALGGTTPGTGYGQLQVAGAVTLNGALSVDFINGFSPALNDSFTILTARTRNGTFSSFNVPSNQVTMEMSNTPTSVIVRVTGLVFPPVPNLLLAPEIAGSDFKLCWDASPNVAYRVEFTPGLNPPDWNALPGEITVVGNTACVLDPLGSSSRFYRVRIIP